MIMRLFTTICCVISLAVCHGLVAEDPKTDNEGTIPIFDDKTLTGWEEMPEVASGAWSVVDGAMVGEGEISNRPFTNRSRIN